MLRLRPLFAAAVVVAFAALPVEARAVDWTDPIPPSVGVQGSGGFHVNPEVPAGLDSARWVSMVQRTLPRWGLQYLGTTTARPGLDSDQHDGVQVIGFEPRPPGVLGTARDRISTLVTTTVVTPDPTTVCRVVRTVTRKPGQETRVVSRQRRVALRRNGKIVRRLGKAVRRNGKVVRRNGRVVRRRGRAVMVWKTVRVRETVDVVREVPSERQDCQSVPGVPYTTETTESTKETDISMSVAARWQMGPAYPAANELDLESVLIHEIGHAAGNPHVAAACSLDTPMTATTTAGDWWRALGDARIDGCLASPPSGG